MSSGKTIVSGLAGRYATALFDLAVEQKAIDAVEGDLMKVQAALSQSADFVAMVQSPILSASEQVGALQAVAKKVKLGETATNFLCVLATNRRLTQLASVIDAFNKLVAAHRGEITAKVISAHKLSTKQLDALSANLKSAMGQDVNLETEIDESLLGGLVVKVGSQMLDSSIKSKLQNLQGSMKGV